MLHRHASGVRRKFARALSFTCLALLGSGCADGFFTQAAAPQKGALSIGYALGANERAGDAAAAYLKTDQARIRVTGGGLAVDTVLLFVAGEARLRLDVDSPNDTKPVQVQIELRRGTDVLFSGSTSVTLSPGIVASANVNVVSVASTVSITIPSSTMNIGDTSTVSGALVFATGDVISGAKITWSSSNTSIITVDSLGRLRAISDGTAQITASGGGATKVTSVTVNFIPGSANGRITNVATRVPIAGVSVALNQSSGVLVQTAVTDANGFYQFTGVRPGSYDKVYTATGFRTSSAFEPIQAGQTLVHDITMLPTGPIGVYTFDLSAANSLQAITGALFPDLSISSAGGSATVSAGNPGLPFSFPFTTWYRDGKLNYVFSNPLPPGGSFFSFSNSISVFQLLSGTYTYSVTRAVNSPGTFAEMAPGLELYAGGTTPVLTVRPPVGSGLRWTVLRIVNGQITTINQVQ